MRTHQGLCAAASASMVAVALASPAAAGLFSVTIQESGGAPVPIVDNGPLDSNVLVGSILVDVTSLNLLLARFDFSSLAAASNATLGTPGSNDPASLTHTGEVTRRVGQGNATVTITATDTDYLFPSLNPKFMDSGASDLFSFTTTGDSRTFQSFFDPGNVALGMTVPSPLLTFSPPAGSGPFGTSGDAPTTALGTQPTPFSLTHQTVITLGPAGSIATRPRDQFTAATIITPIPEPAAALAGLGLGAALFLPALRRHVRR